MISGERGKREHVFKTEKNAQSWASGPLFLRSFPLSHLGASRTCLAPAAHPGPASEQKLG